MLKQCCGFFTGLPTCTVPLRNKRPKIYAKYAYVFAHTCVCISAYAYVRMHMCVYSAYAYAH